MVPLGAALDDGAGEIAEGLAEPFEEALEIERVVEALIGGMGKLRLAEMIEKVVDRRAEAGEHRPLARDLRDRGRGARRVEQARQVGGEALLLERHEVERRLRLADGLVVEELRVGHRLPRAAADRAG